MPHVKILAAPTLAELYPRLPLFERKDALGLRKVVAYYLEREGKLILAEAVVAAGGLPQRFFISLKGETEEVVIRLAPATDPEKTEGVKRLIAEVALLVLGLCPDARRGSTNLAQELAAAGGPSSG